MAEPASESASTPPASATSLSLLARVRDNDPDAWRRLVPLYSPLIFYWCQRLGLSREDAADTLQNVWQSVTGHIGRFDRAGGSFRGWLWTITRNKVYDQVRKERAAPAVATGGSAALQALHEFPEQEPSSYVEESTADGAGDVLRRALEMIRPDFGAHTWQAFWLATVEGQSAREIGEQLGMSLDAVYQAKARILRRLREELDGVLDDVVLK